MAFKKDFIWCVGGAAAQQDGGACEGGKGLTIWDKPFIDGHIKNGDDCSVACDHFHRWKEDFKILKEIGVNTYRFSVCPARIFPQDEFTVNGQGVRFYRDLVAELKRLHIEPIVTLYHWDLPMWLNDIGGWKNPKAIEWFERYTETMVKALSDTVQYWLTFNEPSIFVGLGYSAGVHAPFYQLPVRDIQTISRNIMLAHGRSVKAIRKYAQRTPKISFANATGVVMPVAGKSEDCAYEASFDATKNGVFNAAWWAHPMVLGKRVKGCDWLSDDDLQEICQPLDFMGFNAYSLECTEDFNCDYPGIPRTMMGWHITPDCLYYVSKYLYRRYGLPIMVTENGMANVDMIFEDGRVHDPQRSEYLRTHIRGLKKANDEGVPVIGYSCWSFMDNFEWAEGYEKRFGLVYVDYRTQERVVKDSAYTYREIIETNGNNL